MPSASWSVTPDSGCPVVGDEGLARLDGLTNLTYVSASKATVSAYGKRQFELAHPGAKIFLLGSPTQ